VGRIGVVDDDAVELSNLQRQIIHGTESVGHPKVASAKAAIAALNPEIRVETHGVRLSPANAAELVAGYDLIADGSDNFATRYLLNDACYLGKKPLVSAALLRFDAQLSVFKAFLGPPHPCYRCLFPEQPPADLVPRCEEAGIFGAIAGGIGALQATEVLKELLGLGESLSGRLLIYDGLATEFRTLRVARDPACRLCGAQATIHDLSEHRR
jgi:adenylyltransferase/sulfurtransferase